MLTSGVRSEEKVMSFKAFINGLATQPGDSFMKIES